MPTKNESKIILIFDDNPYAHDQADSNNKYTIKIVRPKPDNSYTGNNAEATKAVDYLKAVDSSLKDYLAQTEAILIDHKMTGLNEVSTKEILEKVNSSCKKRPKKCSVFFFTGGDGLSILAFEKLDEKYSALKFERTIRKQPDSEWVIRSLEKNKSEAFKQFEKHYKNFPAPLRVIHKEEGVIYYNDKWQGVIDKPDANSFFDDHGAKTEVTSYAELNPSEPEDEDNFNYPVTEIHSFVDDEINEQLKTQEGKECHYLVQFVQVVLPEKGADAPYILSQLQERFDNSKFDDGSFIELQYYDLDAFKIEGERVFYTKSLVWKKERKDKENECLVRKPFPHEEVIRYSKGNSKGRKLIAIPNKKDATELFIPIYLNEKYTELIATLVLKIRTKENKYISFEENKINRVEGSIYNAMLGIRHFSKNSKQNNWNQLHQKFDTLQKIKPEEVLKLLERIVTIACEESKSEMVFLSTTSKVLFPHPTTKIAHNNASWAKKIELYLKQGFKLNFDSSESIMPSVIAKDKRKSILWLKEHHEKEFECLSETYKSGEGFSADVEEGKQSLITHLEKCKSILAMPVKVGGDVVAVFAMHSHKSYAFDLKMIDLLDFLVDCSENILNHYYRQSLQKTFVEGVAHEQRNMLEPLDNQISQIEDASSKLKEIVAVFSGTEYRNTLEHLKCQVEDGSSKLKMVSDNFARSVHNIMIVYDTSETDDRYRKKSIINFYKEVSDVIKVRESIDRRLGDRNVTFEFIEKPNNKKANIKSNLLSIQLILNNVLDNSVKYSDANSTIQIKLGIEDKIVTLHIINDINPDQDRPKQQIESVEYGIKSTGHGYGVGLNVCERLSRWLDMEFITEEKDNRFFCTLKVKSSE